LQLSQNVSTIISWIFLSPPLLIFQKFPLVKKFVTRFLIFFCLEYELRNVFSEILSNLP
jgi:hypothetical protein